MKAKKIVLWLILGIAATVSVVVGCLTTYDKNTTGQPNTLKLLTHDSYDIGAEVIQRFEQENNAEIVFIKGGDAGMVLNTVILNRDAPVADLMFGVDNTYLSRALDAEIFEKYRSELVAKLAPSIRTEDTGDQLTPVSYGDVCINYDKAWFEQHAIAVPQTLDDLAEPRYQDLLVVENPASSSPGLAFLLATIGYFGEAGYEDYWARLVNNGIKVSDGWEQAYWEDFSAAGGGDRPLVVSYATSPAAEVYFGEGAYTEPPTGIMDSAGSCFRQIEYVGILKGTDNLELAQKFVDFMLGRDYQEDIPLHMWVYPGNTEARLTGDFAEFATQVSDPAVVSAEDISQKRETWIKAWSRLVEE